MRVLYLNPFSQEVSGPDESLLALLSGLIPMGVVPHVVLPRPGPQVARYEALGARVHYAPLTFLKRRMGAGDLALLLPRLVRGVLAISRIARRERIELVHTNMEVVLDGALAARLLHLPHVMHYRGNTLDRPKLVFDLLTRYWTTMADRVLCISNATADIFRKRGKGARVEVVYNPVDLAAYARARRSESVRASLGAGPEDVLVGTVGRIHPRKGFATFLRAVALASCEMPNLRAAIIGTAEVPEEVAHRSQLEDLTRSLGIEGRVVWAGTRRDMPDVLKALDVFVLASRHEGFGRVVAEAIAAGIPMVLSAEGAFPELAADNKSAVLADAESPQVFADGIRHLIRDATAAGSGHSGSAAQGFAVEHVSAAVNREYQSLLARREATHAHG